MFKNQPGQKLRVFASDVTTNLPKLGDASNITCKVSLNNDAAIAIEDVNPIETEDGFYLFSLTQAETNGDVLDYYPESSTPDVFIIVTNHDRQSVVPPIELINGQIGSLATSSQEYGPRRVKTPNLEVEQFDPNIIAKAVERENSGHPLIGDFAIAIASPNYDVYGNKKCGC